MSPSAGHSLCCCGWQHEALRTLQNNFHPDVARQPEDLVRLGGWKV
ncbi:MAG: hypothetical protein M3022_17025 [Actinomycetota bacterium]|nr:hypothetical protein [Actinomycetota bacterium]